MGYGKRWWLLAAACCVLLGTNEASLAARVVPTYEEPLALFNGKDFTGWKRYLDPNSKADPDQIWTIEDGVIKCDGSVNGYLITEKEYGDYVLKLEWRWGQKGRPWSK